MEAFNDNRRMTAKWWAFGLWAAVAATAVFWGLKLLVPGAPVPPRATVAALAASPHGDLSRLLGADAAPAALAEPAASSRFQLVGVVAPRGNFPSREGVALIAVDGKPAKAYHVGAVVEGDTVLQAVAQRGAKLGPREGAATVALDIPPPAPAATGALPSAGITMPAQVTTPRPPLPGVAPPRPVPPPALQPHEQTNGEPRSQQLPTQ